MKKLLMLGVILAFSIQGKSEKVYKSIKGYGSIEEAMPAIFYALPFQYGYKEFYPGKGELQTPTRKYNDFGMVQKRVDFKFSFVDGEIQMTYSGHQMEDKTRGEWEDCPSKLTKKDNKFFEEYTNALTQYKSDAQFKKEVDAKFYSNAKL
ncbi:MAG: hypothetical protein N4A46_06185, partial [Schleiferiaceae bacterium]|nr:hypothetical protein [Schleiferiaceae bacterium]